VKAEYRQYRVSTSTLLSCHTVLTEMMSERRTSPSVLTLQHIKQSNHWRWAPHCWQINDM